MRGMHGILPAVITPLDERGQFHSPSFEQLLDRLFGAGCNGVYVCGQTGEGLLLPVEERKKAAEAAARCSPGGSQVIVHVGSHRTEEALALARHASRTGVLAVSSLPPIGPYSFAEIRAYYQALAAASDVPVLLYWFPEFCPAVSETDQILDLLAIPNVIGLKFTDFDLFRLSTLKKTGAVVFNGRDEILAAGLLMGADGGIGSFYNLVPEWFVELYLLARAGRWEEASRVQMRINSLIEVVLRFPLIPTLKRMLTWSGIECGGCVEPRLGLSESDESCLLGMLQERIEPQHLEQVLRVVPD